MRTVPRETSLSATLVRLGKLASPRPMPPFATLPIDHLLPLVPAGRTATEDWLPTIRFGRRMTAVAEIRR